MTHSAIRYHDISCGHRVYQHESKCAHLHGHNYRVHFRCESDDLDSVGRVIDFSEIKSRLCMWLEDQWDHKMLIWNEDPWAQGLIDIDPTVVIVLFNPTAENLSQYLVEVIGPQQLSGTGIRLTQVVIEETRKCSVEYRTGA